MSTRCLTIPNIICPDRWKEEWLKIEARLRQQARERRTQLHHSRKVAPVMEPVAPKPLLDDHILQNIADRLAQPNDPK